MDPEARMKRQSRRVIISEAIMVVSVVLMVVVLALLVSGYWVNSDFKVERQGMLQISSFPTGASVEVDGDAPWFQRTNTSKVLSSGEHTIKLEKEGYDTWSKTINISEGLLYRLHYPRLFLNERTKSSVYDLTGATFTTISPARDKMLIADRTISWRLVNLENEKLEPKTINIAEVFTSTDAKTFTGNILAADWSADGSHILFKVGHDEAIEWILLNLNNPTENINLTTEFAATFSNLEIIDNSANTLLAVRNGNLHKIDVPSRQLSATLVQNIVSFDHLGSEIVFAARISIPATDTTESTTAYQIGLLRLGDSSPKILMTKDVSPRVFISRFYEEKYITTITEKQITIYKKDFPEEVFLTSEISFTPTSVKVGYDGSFFTMVNGTSVATFDMEAEALREWTLGSEKSGWLTSDMLYAIKDGTLLVYDYDGLNQRNLSSNVSSKYPITITNNKWLYYVSDNALIREIIAD